MTTATLDAIDRLAEAFAAAHATGTLARDSECWLTFQLSQGDYALAAGTEEIDESGEAIHGKVLYESGGCVIELVPKD